MKLPEDNKSPQTRQQQQSTPHIISGSSHLTITLRIQPVTAKKPHHRPVQRADNVIIETPRYRHQYHQQQQLSEARIPPPTPTVFVFRPAPVVFLLPGGDAASERGVKTLRREKKGGLGVGEQRLADGLSQG